MKAKYTEDGWEFEGTPEEIIAIGVFTADRAEARVKQEQKEQRKEQRSEERNYKRGPYKTKAVFKKNKPWTKEDDAKLVQLAKGMAGQSLRKQSRVLAKELGRTWKAVYLRMYHVGLTKSRKDKTTTKPQAQLHSISESLYAQLGATVDEKIVRSALEHVAKTHGRLRYVDSAYVLGIDKIAAWNGFVINVVQHADTIANDFGVEQKFKLVKEGNVFDLVYA